jgi:hypothetical protein
MPVRRADWQKSIKAIEFHHRLASRGLDDLLRASKEGPSRLPADVTTQDLRQAIGDLEDFYLVRLFSEFEAGLRDYWSSFRSTNPAVKTLIDAIASRRMILHSVRDPVHDIRRRRNDLVHQRTSSIPRIEVSEGRRRLQIFFSHLPPHW